MNSDPLSDSNGIAQLHADLLEERRVRVELQEEVERLRAENAMLTENIRKDAALVELGNRILSSAINAVALNEANGGNVP